MGAGEVAKCSAAACLAVIVAVAALHSGCCFRMVGGKGLANTMRNGAGP
jgi:hypothetical protein